MNNTAFNLEEYEKLDPSVALTVDGKKIRYAIPNMQTYGRVATLDTKEPDTMAWIAEFQPSEALVDIGANVGMYSIWAAATRGTKVYAFEPESQNYALLNKNIFINQLHDSIKAFSVAISDEEGFSDLNLAGFLYGGSCHTYGEAVDFNLQPAAPVFRQGCYAITLDALIARGVIPTPDYIKIDVDGIEHKIIAGCKEVLKSPKLKSVLVELNTKLEEHVAIIHQMKELGFGLSEEQLKIAIRTEGPFKDIGNHIFRRDLA